MPIHDLGYRGWQGRLIPQVGRFWVIAHTGVRLAWRTAWLRRLLLFSWLPAVYVGALFLAYEQLLAPGSVGEAFIPWIREIPLSNNRHQVWSCLLWVFFRYPQIILMVLIVGQVAPPLVSQDVRTKAFLLYFSRPLARFEYVLGKLAVVWFYMAMVSTVPALALYVLGVLLSPDIGTVLSTWDLPLRILGASAVLMVPTAAVALALSSLTTETRYATFGWFALCILSTATYGVLRGFLPLSADLQRWSLLSLHHTLGTVEYWAFGLKHELAGHVVPLASHIGFLPAPSQMHVWPAAVELIVITLVALAILFRRVSSPMRV